VYGKQLRFDCDNVEEQVCQNEKGRLLNAMLVRSIAFLVGQVKDKLRTWKDLGYPGGFVCGDHIVTRHTSHITCDKRQFSINHKNLQNNLNSSTSTAIVS
jgi:hypothetical protein